MTSALHSPFSFRSWWRQGVMLLALITLFTGALAGDAFALADTFACTANGDSNSNMIDNGDCNANGGIFGQVLCYFKTSVGTTLAKMYCKFQFMLLTPIKVLIALVVAVFGVSIALGRVRMSPKEIMMTLMKIVLVYLFATNADWAIGIGYKFFMAVAEEGANMMLNALAGGNATGTTALNAKLTAPDSIFSSYLSAINNTPNPTGYTNTARLSDAVLPAWCVANLPMMGMFLMFFLPPVMIFIVILILQWLGLYAKALLGYLTSIVLLSFLFILSPIFVSFALFRVTKPLFEMWLKYLTNFSLQVVIIFAFLALLDIAPLGVFVKQVLGLVKEYDITHLKSFIPMPTHQCGICDYTIGAATPQSFGLQTITCNAAAGGTAPLGYVKSADNRFNVITLWGLLGHRDLILVVVSQIIALWLIGKVLEGFIKTAPELAKQLAGNAPNVAVLGGAGSKLGGSIPYIGLGAVTAGFVGFRNRFTKNPLDMNIGRRFSAGLAGAAAGMMHGANDETTAAGAMRAATLARISRRVGELQTGYQTAQRTTVANYEEMEDALVAVKDMAEGAPSPEEMEAALERLKAAKKQHLEAIKAERRAKQELAQEAAYYNRASGAEQEFAGVMGSRQMDEFGVANAGAITSESSLLHDIYITGDEARQRLDKHWKQNYEKLIYGQVQPEGQTGYYFLDGANARVAQDMLPLDQLRQNGQGLVSTIESEIGLMGGLVATEAMADIGGRLATAKAALAKAHTQEEFAAAMGDLNGINRDLNNAYASALNAKKKEDGTEAPTETNATEPPETNAANKVTETEKAAMEDELQRKLTLIEEKINREGIKLTPSQLEWLESKMRYAESFMNEELDAAQYNDTIAQLDMMGRGINPLADEESRKRYEASLQDLAPSPEPEPEPISAYGQSSTEPQAQARYDADALASTESQVAVADYVTDLARQLEAASYLLPESTVNQVAASLEQASNAMNSARTVEDYNAILRNLESIRTMLR